MAWHNDLGKWGEDKAAEYLRKKGWYIRHRDWHCGHKDIDIVAIDEDSTMLLFVEVKTRATDYWGQPDEAIDLEKQNNILLASNAYRKAFRMEWIDVRYDSISIIGTTDENMKIIHKEGAFDNSSNFFYKEQKRKRSYYKRKRGLWNS